MNTPNDQWARDALIKLAEASLVEQRIKRRWNLIFKLLVLAYLTTILFAVWPREGFELSEKSHTALVRINGTIAHDQEANSENTIKSLRRAFESPHSKGVVIAINSPGGSPVQAAEIFDAIRELRKQHPNKPLFAVIGDVGASGGYYIAAAADKIYANSSSLVGSIGVIAGGFGFVDLINQLGIERRAYVAGENKALLDPFSPENPAHRAFFQGQLDLVHQQFVDAVKQGRGDRLAENDEIFSGYIWAGSAAKELGLIDDLGTVQSVAEQEIKAAEIVDYTRKGGFLDRFARRFALELYYGLTTWQWR